MNGLKNFDKLTGNLY